MANCCYVIYKCVGKREQLDELNAALHLMMDRKMPALEAKWGSTWLGWLVAALYGDVDDNKLRGRILDFNYDGEVLTINQETDWEEQWWLRDFLKDKFPDIDIYYREEEPSADVFGTNDAEGRFFPHRYLLESNDDAQYFHTLEEAAETVADIVGHEVAPTEEEIDEALDDFMEEHEEAFFSFHHIKIYESFV